MMSFKPLPLWLCVRKRAVIKATEERTEILRVQPGSQEESVVLRELSDLDDIKFKCKYNSR